MNAKDYRKISRGIAESAAEDLTLPSGMVIRARRPAPLEIAMWGSLPLALTAEVQQVDGEKPKPSTETILANIELSRQLLVFAFVNPRISQHPVGDDEIQPSEIPGDDAAYVIRWAMHREEADGLRRFRPVGEFPSSRDHGEDVRPETIGAFGDSGSSTGAGDRPGGSHGTHHSTPTPRIRS